MPAGQTGAGTYLVTWNGHGDALALWRIESGGTLTLANSFTYGTWGAPATATHNSFADLGFRFLYVGAYDVQWDDAYGLGLTYMHARHYSPALGRFLQPDPARAEANAYAYVGNNPVSRLDPSGQWWPIIGILVRTVAPLIPSIVRSVVSRYLPTVPTVVATGTGISQRLGDKLQSHWWPAGLSTSASASQISAVVGQSSKWLPDMTATRFQTIIRAAQFSRAEVISGVARITKFSPVNGRYQYSITTTYTFPFRVGWDAVGQRWTNTVTYSFHNGTLTAFPGRSKAWWDYVRSTGPR